MTEEKIRLNLGGGINPMPGYLNVDIKDGIEIGALPHDDGSVDEIRASHVLEHVSHRRTDQVLRHWFAKLRPGGLLKVAVPNLQYIFERMNQNSEEPLEEYLFGSHSDPDDKHGACFSRSKLEAQLSCAGFEFVEGWESEDKDCSSLPVSLNLQAIKPLPIDMSDTAMLMSMPRISFTSTMFSVLKIKAQLNMPMIASTGAYWGQCLERIMEKAIADHPNLKWILTVDFDSVFEPWQVRKLRYVADKTNSDAVYPVQCKRDATYPMVTIRDADGNLRHGLTRNDTLAEVIDTATGHFGLTLLRLSALKQLPKPWFRELPSPNNDWNDGHVDSDIYFWKQWKEAGFTQRIVPRVKIGHAQQLITWPDERWAARHQFINDWEDNGTPDYARI